MKAAAIPPVLCIFLFSCAAALAAPIEYPTVGSDAFAAMEARTDALDPHTASSISMRSIPLNAFESLMTRDENISRIPELTKRAEVSEARVGFGGATVNQRAPPARQEYSSECRGWPWRGPTQTALAR